MRSDKKILVSVCMITYKHEEFIKEAIEGVLNQKCDFDIELIIADDCSPDKTETIVKNIISDYKGKYLIRYVRHEENMGMMANFAWALAQCNGKYIALCEGDDYWTDLDKLQKQIDFMESNADCSMCFHSAIVLSEIDKDYSNLDKRFSNIEERFYSGEEILKEWTIPTASVVFRAVYLNKTTSLRNDADYYHADIVLFLSMAEYGRIYGMKNPMSVYRKHEGGFTTYSSFQNNLNIQKHLLAIKRNFKKYYPEINTLFANNNYNLFTMYLRRWKIKNSLNSFFRAFVIAPGTVTLRLSKSIYKNLLKILG